MKIFFFNVRRWFLVLLYLIISAAALQTAQAAGELDTTFSGSAYGSQTNTISVTTSKLQADGKLLVGGIFSVVNGTARSSVVRLNPDGSLDTTFIPPALYDLNRTFNPGNIYAIGIQSDGKVIVGGSFGVTGSTTRDLIRLNTDGSLDPTFNNLGSRFDTFDVIYGIDVRPNDALYINGLFEFNYGANGLASGAARLDSSGVPDTSFRFARINPDSYNTVRSLAVTGDNRVYAAAQSSSSNRSVRRYNSDGNPDSSFQTILPNGDVLKIVIQSDGKILLGGGFTMINGFNQSGISRITPDGTIDTNFNSGAFASGTAGTGGVFDIDLTADGKIVVSGGFARYGNIQSVAIIRLNGDGSTDTSFRTPFTTLRNISTTSVQNDGKIIIFAAGPNSPVPSNLLRLTSGGDIDSTYQTNIFSTTGTVYDVVQQPDGKILAGGTFTFANRSQIYSLARFNSDGSLDTTFQTAHLANSSTVNRIAFQSNGKTLIAGIIYTSGGNISIERLLSDGSVDSSFARYSIGEAKDLTVLADDRILLAANNTLTRLTANGILDSSFSRVNLAGGTILSVKVQPDNKILIGGTFTQVNAVARNYIARLNADGTLDTTFAPPVGANAAVTNIDIQSDGKIILVGDFTFFNDLLRFHVARANSDGSLDSSFNPPDVSGYLTTVKVQPNGKILIGGEFKFLANTAFRNYARLNTDGSLDFSLVNDGGANGAVNRINLQSDGKILLGGVFSTVNNASAVGIARLLNPSSNARTLFDFDGDSRADLSVFRPSSGVWYLQQSTDGFAGVSFGISSDQLVPADYDGDGKTDIAVYRNGTWYLNRSTQGFTGVPFGTSGDIPVPADYDGDGKADIAVFRPSNGTWYLQRSAAGLTQLNFGQNGDKPTVGDYDGDGKANLSVFRPSNGTWYIARPTGVPAQNYDSIAFGANGDLATPADYDGDGKTDVAVFRPSNGTWYLNRSTLGFAGIQFGQTGDLPAAADYDGDGKADVAVFRGGAWYLNRTTAGFTGIAFGIGEDKPTPNAFVR